VPKDEQVPPGPVGPDKRQLLTVVGVSADDGIVWVLRAVSLPHDVSVALHAAIADQMQHSAARTRAVVVRTVALHLLDLHTRIAELEAALVELLRADPPSQQLQAQVPGLGPLWTATIRAELGDVSRFARVDQLVAYAGLEPRPHESGRLAGQRHLSKRGPGALRHALSMATLVAVRFRPEWRTRYAHLLERGRAKKEALTILSRKLLLDISHLLRTGASYDPTYITPPRRRGGGDMPI